MIPYNMWTQGLKLDEGEEVVLSEPANRIKMPLGTRYGVIYVTNKRVAFVKSVMRMGIIGKIFYSKTAKPWFSLDRATIKAEMTDGKLANFILKDAQREEKFQIQQESADRLISTLQ